MQDSSALNNLRFKSDEITIPEENPFANDKLSREPFIQAVTQLLTTIQEPFVIALNAPWGSGKSTTFNILEHQLKNKGILSVSFNAWEVDYATDPLIPLVAVLHEQLLKIKGNPAYISGEKIEKFKNLGGAIIKHGAIAAMKVATAGIIDGAALTAEISKAAEKASEDFTSDIIDAFKREKDAAQKFRQLLREITEHVRKKNDSEISPPVVLLIDELDRCRPTFAVAMLERIKHFFSVPGLVFILALDLSQLKASTKKVYGSEIDAAEYLQRFIDLELVLPRASVGEMVNSMLSNCGADAYFAERSNIQETREDRQWVVNVIKCLSNNFELSPRKIQRMISRLMLVLRQTPKNKYLDPILVVFMIFLRMHNSDILKNLVAGRLSAQGVMECVVNKQSNGVEFRDSHVGRMIEAHLLFAQNSLKTREYTAEFIETAQKIPASDSSSKSIRERDILGYYQRLSSFYFRRGGIDLKDIDRRINLISSDFTDVD